MIDAASCTKQFSFKQSCRVVMGSEDASGNRRELLEDPRCLNMVLQERVARSHIVVFNGCFVAVLETHRIKVLQSKCVWVLFAESTLRDGKLFLAEGFCLSIMPRNAVDEWLRRYTNGVSQVDLTIRP